MMMRYSVGFTKLSVLILEVEMRLKEKVDFELEVGSEAKVGLELETECQLEIDYALMTSADALLLELEVLLELFLWITESLFERPRLL